MPTLNSGQSATVTVPAGMPFRVNTTSEATVSQTWQGGSPVFLDRLVGSNLSKIYPANSGTQTYLIAGVSGVTDYGGGYVGPVNATADIVTSAQLSAINSALAAGVASYPTSYKLIVDGVSYILKGSGQSASFVIDGGSLFPMSVRGGVSLDGNSLTANVITETSGSAAVDNVLFGGGTQFDFHWFHKTNAILGGKMHIVKNNAIGGSTLQSILDRWDVPATNPLLDDTDVLFLEPAAINSINRSLGAVSIPSILAQYETLISRASAAKKAVICSSEWPVAPGWSGYQYVNLIPFFNVQFAAICAKYPNVIFIDSWSVLTDPATANGDAKTGVTRADFIHPTKKTANVLAPYQAAQLAGKLLITESRTYNRISVQWSGPSGTRNSNAGAGLTTVVTGDAPFTGWDCSVTAGPAVATGVTVAGVRDQTALQYFITGSNTSATDITIEVRATTSSHASAPVGSRVFARAGIGASSCVNVKQTDVQMIRGGSATTPICARIRTNYAEDQTAFTDYPVTGDYTVAAGLTDLRPSVVFKVGANTGAFNFVVTEPQLNLVTG